MSRNIPADITAALSDTVLYPFFAVELSFDAPNELYYWSGLGDLLLDGKTYVGTGTLLQIGEVTETADIQAVNATVTLSGIPSELIALAKDEPYQGRAAKIKFGLMDVASSRLLAEDGTYILTEAGERIQLSGNPHSMFDLFVGVMDQMRIQEGAETSIITLSIASNLERLESRVVRRYTSEYQKSVYPLDKAFDFVNDLQTRELMWGRK